MNLFIGEFVFVSLFFQVITYSAYHHPPTQVADSKSVENAFGDVSVIGNAEKKFYNFYQDKKKFTTICWKEKTTLTFYKNGKTRGYTEYSIILEKAPELLKTPSEFRAIDKYEIFDETSHKKQVLDFVTVHRDLQKSVKENVTINCKTNQAYLKIFTGNKNSKKVEIRLKPVLKSASLGGESLPSRHSSRKNSNKLFQKLSSSYSAEDSFQRHDESYYHNYHSKSWEGRSFSEHSPEDFSDDQFGVSYLVNPEINPGSSNAETQVTTAASADKDSQTNDHIDLSDDAENPSDRAPHFAAQRFIHEEPFKKRSHDPTTQKPSQSSSECSAEDSGSLKCSSEQKSKSSSECSSENSASSECSSKKSSKSSSECSSENSGSSECSSKEKNSSECSSEGASSSSECSSKKPSSPCNNPAGSNPQPCAINGKDIVPSLLKVLGGRYPIKFFGVLGVNDPKSPVIKNGAINVSQFWHSLGSCLKSDQKVNSDINQDMIKMTKLFFNNQLTENSFCSEIYKLLRLPKKQK